MAEIIVLEAEAADVPALAGAMRATDRDAALGLVGVPPQRLLWWNFRLSLFRHVAMVDGELAAMWGVRGCALGGYGEPWLVGTSLMDRYPVTAVRMALDEIAAMRNIWPRLTGLVVLADERACRFATFLGAAIAKTEYRPGVAAFEFAERAVA